MEREFRIFGFGGERSEKEEEIPRATMGTNIKLKRRHIGVWRVSRIQTWSTQVGERGQCSYGQFTIPLLAPLLTVFIENT